MTPSFMMSLKLCSGRVISVMSVSYTHLDVYKRQAFAFTVMVAVLLGAD